MKEYLWGETYTVDEDMSAIMEILNLAIKYNNCNQEYLIPYSFWSDYLGWLYIKWILKDSESKAVVRYKLDETGDLIVDKIKVNLSKEELLRGNDFNKPVVLITGDTHRDFNRIIKFCETYKTTKDDVLIILGDAGINYCNDKRDIYVKDRLSQLPITLFCIHGNHEMRPESIETYKLSSWHGGKVYLESKYTNILFAKDGEIYDIDGKKTLVIGGAYSVDKWYRLKAGWGWFEDEQPSDAIKEHVEKQLDNASWKVDVVLSHTTPYQYRPIDLFLTNIDQSTVDSSTEEWLRTIEEKLTYEKWYAGHYHCDRVVDKLQIMFKKVELFCGKRDLHFSME